MYLDALPKRFHDALLMSGLDQLKESLECGVRVYVIGQHDIDGSKLVFTSPGHRNQKETTTEPHISVVVWHTSLVHLEEKELQGMLTSFKIVSAYTKRLGLNNNIFIKCDVSQQYSKEEITEIKNTIFAALCDDTSENRFHPKDILIDCGDCDLNTSISDKLEKFVADGFSNIYSNLKRFEYVTSESGSENTNVLEIDTVAISIKEFLRNARNNIEVNKTLTEEIEETASGKILQYLLHSLCRVIKCTLVKPLAKKIGLKTWICNGLLHEIQFEEALAEAVSKNTRHLKKLASSTYKARRDGIRYTRKCNKFELICFPLQTEMKPVVERAEKKLLSMQRTSKVIRRMAFETYGYLRQTNIDSPEQTIHQPVKLPDVLRKDLLHIPGVYGLGTIYGELEIHLDKETVKTSTDSSSGTDELQSKSKNDADAKHQELQSKSKNDADAKHQELQSKSKDDADAKQQELHSKSKDDADEKHQTSSEKLDIKQSIRLKSEIAKTLQKHQYRGRYSVKYVQNKPGEVAANYEPGDKLMHQGRKGFGTLGGFIFSKDGKLHGLTCGHIVGDDMDIYIDKTIRELLSCCSKVVNHGNGELKYIDIAALEIHPSLQSECKRSLERSSDRITKVKQAEDHPEKMIGNTVYKYGAATGRTTGFIVSIDYRVLGMVTKDYLVIINTVPDIPSGFSEDFSSLISKEDDHQDGNTTAMETDNTTLNETSYDEAHSDADADEEKMDIEFCSGPSQINYDNSSLEPGCSGNKKIKLDDRKSSKMKYSEGNNTLVQKNENSEIEGGSFLQVRGTNGADEEQIKGIHLSLRENVNNRLGSDAIFRHPLVYVLRNTSNLGPTSLDSNDCETPDEVFAKRGDSGSIICIPEPTHSKLDCVALSMLFAGDFKTDGDESLKCLSFKLNVGLHTLMQRHQLDF
ncbi:uncharacterized protein LOC128553016 [Mercenaria mercenaria]|uniref:uncharacterized protein LOC128553016 n=1 Tax=Mercenaria mercenaria TaxID=6596 RepID=UPI00234F2AFC|nr:uncharacterized protein LOC128553016 [Mercenaria mercenaria]